MYYLVNSDTDSIVKKSAKQFKKIKDNEVMVDLQQDIEPQFLKDFIYENGTLVKLESSRKGKAKITRDKHQRKTKLKVHANKAFNNDISKKYNKEQQLEDMQKKEYYLTILAGSGLSEQEIRQTIFDASQKLAEGAKSVSYPTNHTEAWESLTQIFQNLDWLHKEKLKYSEYVKKLNACTTDTELVSVGTYKRFSRKNKEATV